MSPFYFLAADSVKTKEEGTHYLRFGRDNNKQQ